MQKNGYLASRHAKGDTKNENDFTVVIYMRTTIPLSCAFNRTPPGNHEPRDSPNTEWYQFRYHSSCSRRSASIMPWSFYPQEFLLPSMARAFKASAGKTSCVLMWPQCSEHATWTANWAAVAAWALLTRCSTHPGCCRALHAEWEHDLVQTGSTLSCHREQVRAQAQICIACHVDALHQQLESVVGVKGKCCCRPVG